MNGKIKVDVEDNCVYITVSSEKIHRTENVCEDPIVNIDKTVDGDVVGIEIITQ